MGLRLLLLIVVIALMAMVLAYGQRGPSTSAPGDVGRYELYGGPQPARAAQENGRAINNLYRIDTRTGRTWVLDLVPNGDGAFSPSWANIREFEPSRAEK